MATRSRAICALVLAACVGSLAGCLHSNGMGNKNNPYATGSENPAPHPFDRGVWSSAYYGNPTWAPVTLGNP
jgi:hypothetical protein